jgi:hypothetical protein
MNSSLKTGLMTALLCSGIALVAQPAAAQLGGAAQGAGGAVNGTASGTMGGGMAPATGTAGAAVNGASPSSIPPSTPMTPATPSMSTLPSTSSLPTNSANASGLNDTKSAATTATDKVKQSRLASRTKKLHNKLASSKLSKARASEASFNGLNSTDKSLTPSNSSTETPMGTLNGSASGSANGSSTSGTIDATGSKSGASMSGSAATNSSANPK